MRFHLLCIIIKDLTFQLPQPAVAERRVGAGAAQLLRHLHPHHGGHGGQSYHLLLLLQGHGDRRIRSLLTGSSSVSSSTMNLL